MYLLSSIIKLCVFVGAFGIKLGWEGELQGKKMKVNRGNRTFVRIFLFPRSSEKMPGGRAESENDNGLNEPEMAKS